MFGLGSNVQESTPQMAAEQLRQGALLVDVREPGEFHAARAPGARNVPLGSLHTAIDRLPRDRTIHLICASGHRSRHAARLLTKAGFCEVFSVRGGTHGWSLSGLPLTRG